MKTNYSKIRKTQLALPIVNASPVHNEYFTMLLSCMMRKVEVLVEVNRKAGSNIAFEVIFFFIHEDEERGYSCPPNVAFG